MALTLEQSTHLFPPAPLLASTIQSAKLKATFFTIMAAREAKVTAKIPPKRHSEGPLKQPRQDDLVESTAVGPRETIPLGVKRLRGPGMVTAPPGAKVSATPITAPLKVPSVGSAGFMRVCATVLPRMFDENTELSGLFGLSIS